MNEGNIIILTKTILWDFFCDCISGKPLNPGNQNYTKRLSAKDEKIIYTAKARMPKLQEILTSTITVIQKETPELLKPGYIKLHFSECAVTLERRAFNIYLENEESLFLSLIDDWVSQNADFLKGLNQEFT